MGLNSQVFESQEPVYVWKTELRVCCGTLVESKVLDSSEEFRVYAQWEQEMDYTVQMTVSFSFRFLKFIQLLIEWSDLKFC